MVKLLIFGTGQLIKAYYGAVARLAAEGDAEILGICRLDDTVLPDDLGGRWPLIGSGAPEWAEADAVLVCMKPFSDEAVGAAIRNGAAREKLVDCRLMEVEGFSFSRYLGLIAQKTTILSNCCFAGLAYHYFRLDFRSPTINLFLRMRTISVSWRTWTRCWKRSRCLPITNTMRTRNWFTRSST